VLFSLPLLPSSPIPSCSLPKNKETSHQFLIAVAKAALALSYNVLHAIATKKVIFDVKLLNLERVIICI
jgi:hypothetical protein